MRNASAAVAAGLADTVPDGVLASRELRAFGGVAEVALHRALPGEQESPALGAVGLSLHLSGPNPLWQRWGGGKPREYVERPGEVATVPPGVPFEQVNRADSEDLHLLFADGFFGRVAAEAGADPGLVEVPQRSELVDPLMERLMRSFVPEIENWGLGGELYAEGLATALAVHLLREHSSLGEGTKRRVAREPRPGGLSARALKRATDYIGDNLASGALSLEGIASEAGYSPHHFSRLFRESTGLPPHQYVIRERVERAKDLLLRGHPVGEATRRVGFSDQSHLSRHFKRFYGVTPASFARRAPFG
jgi:AraC family transcriptional regulator